MDELLDTETYLKCDFQADAKVKAAQEELQTTIEATAEGTEENAMQQKKCAAQICFRRVLAWRDNLRMDLAADSVCSPSCDGKRWLLYLPAEKDASEPRDIQCFFCKHCVSGFQQCSQAGVPKVILSFCARAHGLWGGPEPACIRTLTYAERRILTLARVYVTVKRVLIKNALWAKSDEEALPQESVFILAPHISPLPMSWISSMPFTILVRPNSKNSFTHETFLKIESGLKI